MNKRTIMIVKENEVYGRVICNDAAIMQGLYDYFGIRANNAHFDKRVKAGLWDGKIRFVKRNGQFYLGLFDKILDYLKSQREYTVEVDPLLQSEYDSKSKFKNDFMDVIDKRLNPKFKPYAHQWKGSIKLCYSNRGIIEHCTSSGKSLSIALCVFFILEKDPKNQILILVPRKDLVEQLTEDLIEYGVPADFLGKYVGYQKDEDNEVIIGTWQSCCRNKKFLQRFTAVLGDECHSFKADEIRSVAEAAVNAKIRLGFTGTLPDHISEQYLVQGVFGPVVDVVKAAELQEKGLVSKIKIQIPYIHYDKENDDMLKKSKKLMKGKEAYKFERDFLHRSEERNNFIGKLSKKLIKYDKNVLILINKHDHCDAIVNVLNSLKIDPYVITGKVKDMEVRNNVRKEMEMSSGNIIVATSGVYSTGISIKRLHAIIFADAGKSKITTLQSIGRGLRLHSTKSKLLLFDVSDNVHYGNLHLEQRMEYYSKEGYQIEVKEVNFNGSI